MSKFPPIVNNTEIGCCYGLHGVDKVKLFFWRKTISSFDKKDPPDDQTTHANRYNRSPSVPYVSLYPAMNMSYVEQYITVQWGALYSAGMCQAISPAL